MNRDLRFEVFYPHPPELVWRGLTEREALEEWLMKNDFEAKVGHSFQFRAPPVPGWSGIVDCTVLVCDRPKKLVYSWKSDSIDTIVSYTLTPEGSGTRLVLEHTGFSGLKAVMISFMMGGGWKSHLRKELAQIVARFSQ